MNDAPRNRDRTDPKDKKADRRKEREARLADALRANLKRRKAQERGRAAGSPEDTEPPPDRPPE